MKKTSTLIYRLCFVSIAAAFTLLTSFSASAQLTGIKTIPGDYATIAAAVADLNTLGTGPGGVTFNVAAGHTETGIVPVITATGTASDPIVFQKSGAGANPVVTAGTGSTNIDGIITMEGTDYITFDAIDVMEDAANTTTTSQMEWGYALLNASSTNGCQFVTIRNCNITLNRTNTATVGIYSAHHTSASTIAVNPSSTAGAHSNNQFFGNTISNSYQGIRLQGYAAPSPYTLYDQNNSIGTAATGNTISSYAGGTITAYGIYTIYQNNLTVANNSVASGSGHTTTLYGIYLGAAINASSDVFGNNISLTSSATTSTHYALQNASGSTGTNNTVNIYNNTVNSLNWSPTSGTFYVFYNTASCYNLNMYNNMIANITKSGTGAMYGVYVSGAVVNNVNVYGNTVNNVTLTGTGALYAIYNSPATGSTSQIYNNTVHSNSVGGTFYCIYNTTGNVSNIYTNTVYNNATSSAAGTLAGIYLSAGTTYNVYRNKIGDLTTTGTTGIVYGIYSTTGTTRTISNNLIGSLYAPSTSNALGVAGIYINSGTTINLYYNTVFLNAASTGTTFGTAGIYTSTTPTVDLRNNLVVNNSVPNGTGITAAYRRSTTTLTTLATSSNNNLYYAGSPSAMNAIFYDGTNIDQTLAAYQARVSPAESASVTENSQFISTTASAAGFLHLDPSQATRAESAGAAITGFTDDYDAVNVRTGYPLASQVNGGGTAPDIGADEGDFILLVRDIGVTALLSPSTTGCHSTNETVRVRIENFGPNAIDMSVNNITVTGSATGPNPATFGPLVLTSGMFAVGATIDTTIATGYSMAAAGMYTFNASASVTGDGAGNNNAMQAVTINVTGGTAAAVPASICIGSTATLMISGTTGSIQWQSYDPVSMSWVNETGAGNTSPSYTVSPTDTIIYRALVCGLHPSTADTLEVIDLANPATTSASRCGPGMLTLGASGQGTLKWYDAAAGGNVVNTGTTYNVSLSATDTFYVEATAGPVQNPLKITEVDLGANDQIEIQNMSSSTLNTSGWKVAISDNYTNINAVNSILWNLPATMAPGQILTRTDLSTSPNYWGSNMFWNPGSYPSFTGWAMIIDNNGNVVDFIAWDWPAANIQAMNPTINGNPTTVGTEWSGNGIASSSATAGMGLSRQGTTDNNDASDFAVLSLSIGTTNPGLTYPFQSGCTSPARTQVIGTINPAPVVALGNDTIFCQGGAVTLDAANPGHTYSWSTGATSQTVLADTSGMYAVTVTSSAMCTAADTISITVNPVPAVTLGSDVTQCGGAVSLDPGPGYVSYSWSTGATTQSISASATGSYAVIVQNGFMCSNSDTVMVTINPNPVVTLGADVSFCAGDSTTLDAGNAGMSFAWSEGSTTQAITVNTADIFSVIVTNPATGCSGYDTIVTTINALPVVNLGPDINQCGGSVTLNAGNPGSTFAWSEPYVSQTIPVAASGTYWVQVTNAAGCVASDTIIVAINAVPSVNLGADITQCGGTVTLNAGNAGSSYSWSHGPTTQTTVISSSGNYSVVVTTAQNCTNSDTVMITINPLPVPFAGNDTTICMGASVTLDGGPGYASYSWAENSVIIGTTQTVVVTPAATTTYDLSVTDANGCSSATAAMVTIIVEQAPVAGFTSSITGGFNASFTNTTGSSTTLPFTSSWDFGDSQGATTTNASHTYTANGTYTVTLIVTTACGSDTATQTVIITGVGIEEADMLKEVKVYPNPSDGIFSIELVNPPAGQISVTVTDMTGRTAYNSVLDANGELKRTLDLSSMAKGVYYLRMDSENMTEIRKIVIQ
jgi:trimeric autotransporter adhesin